MASLMEELITTLRSENEVYKELIPLAQEKTKVIVANDLEALEKITEQEQLMIDKVGNLEHKRQEVIVNIGTVLNRNPATLNFTTLIKILEGQKAEQEALRNLHDELKKTIRRLSDINDRNKALLKQSLEMIEFNVNFIQSAWRPPGTGQYGKGADEVYAPFQAGMFDKKQ